MTSDSKTKVAIVYDFDKTLSISEMQDAFIESMGMTAKEFWDESNGFAKRNEMDKILSYLYMMIRDSSRKKMVPTREDLNRIGSEIDFHPGVIEWFDLMDELAEESGVEIEHYLISSGLKEIIEGTPIHDRFKRIYACEYLYDEESKPIWVKNVVNFTTKTQFLFRINKESLDVWNEEGVNAFLPHDFRPIPFENMIYIGDGTTDIPCMKLVNRYGGHSIGVYGKDVRKVQKLKYDDRINFYCKADYRRGEELHSIVSDIVHMIAFDHPLRVKSIRQYNESMEALEPADKWEMEGEKRRSEYAGYLDSYSRHESFSIEMPLIGNRS